MLVSNDEATQVKLGEKFQLSVSKLDFILEKDHEGVVS